jgi:hypothetical protein
MAFSEGIARQNVPGPQSPSLVTLLASFSSQWDEMVPEMLEGTRASTLETPDSAVPDGLLTDRGELPQSSPLRKLS